MRCVIKLGGGILPDEDAYKSRAQQINDLMGDVQQMYVVVSARKGRTKELVKDACGYDEDDIGLLEKALKGSVNGDPRLSDYNNPEVASYLLQGEIDSAYELAKYLPESYVIDQDTPGFPITGNSNYLCGEVDMQTTRDAFSNLEDARLIIIPGFGCRDYHGQKMLMGSNATDWSASITASCVGADKLLFPKDVDGVYSAFETDHPKKLDEVVLNGQDVGEVLHPKVAGPLYGKNIDVRVGHIDKLKPLMKGAEGYGTRIIV